MRTLQQRATMKTHCRILTVFIALLCSFAATGCDRNGTDNSTSTTTTAVSTDILSSSLPDPATSQEELVFGMNSFGMNEYRLVSQDNTTADNLVISAYSISNCLAMIYAGARSNTESQIAGALEYTLPQDSLHETFGSVSADIMSSNNADNASDYTLTLSISNSAWL